MRSPLAPVQARPAKCALRPPARGTPRPDLDAELGEKCQAMFRDDAALLRQIRMARRDERIGQGYAKLAGKMVVTDARSAQRLISGTGHQAFRGRVRVTGDSHDAFQHERNGR